MAKTKVKFPKQIYANYQDEYDEEWDKDSELYTQRKLDNLILSDEEFTSFAIYELKEVKRAKIVTETKTKIIYEE